MVLFNKPHTIPYESSIATIMSVLHCLQRCYQISKNLKMSRDPEHPPPLVGNLSRMH